MQFLVKPVLKVGVGIIILSFLFSTTKAETIKWKYFLGAETWSSPALGKDGIYAACNTNGYLYALNFDGTLKWKFPSGSRIEGSPVVTDEGQIIITSTVIDPITSKLTAHLYVLNPDGTIAWKVHFDGFPNGTPAVDKDGTIYFTGCGDKEKNIGGMIVYVPEVRLYAIKNGILKWMFRVGDYVLLSSSPVIAQDGTIYFGCEEGFFALAPNGSLKWRFQTGDWIWSSSPAINEKGEIFFGSDDGYFYCLYPNGTLKWRYYTGKTQLSPPVIGPKGEVYFTGGGCLFVLTEDGKLKLKLEEWSYPMGTPAIGADNIMYYGTSTGYLYAKTLEGKYKWSIKAEGPVLGGPTLGPDGTIYYTCVGGYVYAAKATPPANTPWPMFHHDCRHTGRAY